MNTATWATRLWWRFAILLMLICAATLLAGGHLSENALRQAEHEAFTARFVLATERAGQAAESALALGVPPAPDTPLAGLLQREAAALAPALQHFTIESETGAPLLSVGAGRSVDASPAEIRMPIRNDLGQTVGWARLAYDDSGLQQAQQQLHQAVQRAVWPALLVMVAAMSLVCALLLHRLQRGLPPPRLAGGERNLLAGAGAITLSLALMWVGWHAHMAGQASIVPEQTVRAEAQARSSAALIARALEVGVPADALVGLQEHADALQRRSPEITALTLQDMDGRWLAGAHLPPGLPAISAPVQRADGSIAGQVLLALDSGVLTRQLRATLLDVAFLGAICLLLALEWVALGLGARGARALTVAEAWRRRRSHSHSHSKDREGLSWRPSATVAVRPALFLFMLAEELTRPFMPTWARELAPSGWGLTPDFLASGPLVVFLAVVALLQWPLASWSQQFGRRRGLVLGALLGALSLAMAGIRPDYVTLLWARLLGAIGFAMVFVSAQGAIIDGSTARDRARSLGQFVRAILVAALCGPPLGGLAADRWGVPTAFMLAAGVAALAALVAWWQMPRADAAALVLPSSPGRQLRPGPLHHSGLWPLLLGCALPAKLLLAALCFYLLPMHLENTGHGSAVVGRLQTVYPLTMVLLVPIAARLADPWQQRRAFIVIGGVLAGLGAWLAWPAGQTPLHLAWALLLLGVGQAMSITPQSARVADLARQQPGTNEAAVLGLFRLTERSGSALGPVLAAWLLPLIGFGPALGVIGTLVVAGSLIYALPASSEHKRI